MTLDGLLDFAQGRGIEIDDVPLRAITAASFPQGWVAFDSSKMETGAEEKTMLAHEVGHIATGSFYNIHSPFDLRERSEHHADKWAIKTLIPLDELRSCLRAGIDQRWEIAEYVGVTEELVGKALELYEDDLEAERRRCH